MRPFIRRQIVLPGSLLVAMSACGQSDSVSSPESFPMVGGVPEEPIAATDDEKAFAQHLVNTFVGGCVQIMPNTDRVIASADSLGWADLPADMAALMAPQGSAEGFHGWFVESGDGPPAMIGVSEADFQGRIMVTCAVTNPYAPPELILEHLQSTIDLGSLLAEDRSMGQQMLIWDFPPLGSSAFVTSTDASPMGQPGITLSVSAPKSGEN